MSRGSEAPDGTLVGRMLAGDERAFDEFFGQYFARLFRFALSRVRGDADAAEEVAQATLCKAVHKLGTYRGESALFTWLCAFCLHEIAHYHRRNKAQFVHVEVLEESADVQAALASAAAGFEGPHQALERAEIGRLVAVALDQLPHHYCRALQWKYLEDLPVKEIAARLELSVKATESLLTRARGALRTAFTTLTETPPARARRAGTVESRS